jgi:hypothetical protein
VLLLRFALCAGVCGAAALPVAVAQDTATPPGEAVADPVTPRSTAESEYDEEWATDFEALDREWRGSKKGPYDAARKAEKLSNDQKKALTAGIEYVLTRMTIKDAEDQIAETRNKLLDELRLSTTTKAAREWMLAEIVRIAPSMLGQRPVVRLNAVILLASLSTEFPQKGAPIPFVPAYEPLIKVLADEQQRVECRIWAAKGLGRICADGNPRPDVRIEAATALLNTLSSSAAKRHVWFRMRVVEAMGFTDRTYNLSNEPVYIDALMSVLNDPGEHPLVRSTAAVSVSQLPWDGNTNVHLIVHEIGRLAQQMAEAQNADLQNKKPGKDWRHAFLNVYLAFSPQNAALAKERKWGIRNQLTRPGLGGYQNVVNGAYQGILPVVNGVLSNPKPAVIGQLAIQTLTKWLEGNLPASRKVTPSSAELNDRAQAPDSGPATPMTGTTTPRPGTGQVFGRPTDTP